MDEIIAKSRQIFKIWLVQFILGFLLIMVSALLQQILNGDNKTSTYFYIMSIPIVFTVVLYIFSMIRTFKLYGLIRDVVGDRNIANNKPSEQIITEKMESMKKYMMWLFIFQLIFFFPLSPLIQLILMAIYYFKFNEFNGDLNRINK